MMDRFRQRFWMRNGWSPWHAAAALAFVVLGVVVTWDAWRDIHHIASRDEESSHIFLVPIVVGWLIWVRRRRLRHCRPVGQWIGPLLVAAGWFFHSIGSIWLIQSFWHGGAVLLVVGCLLTIVGKEIPRQILPALLALVFLIPVPGRVRQRVAIPMGTASAQVTQKLFDVGGIDVERRGNLLRLNEVDVTIAEACNGLRMVFALGMVSYAFAFGTPLRWYARVLILAATPLSALLCNVIRLMPTVWIYGHYPSIAETFHDLSGWAMLILSFLILMGILRVLRWALVPVEQHTLAYD